MKPENCGFKMNLHFLCANFQVNHVKNSGVELLKDGWLEDLFSFWVLVTFPGFIIRKIGGAPFLLVISEICLRQYPKVTRGEFLVERCIILW